MTLCMCSRCTSVHTGLGCLQPLHGFCGRQALMRPSQEGQGAHHVRGLQARDDVGENIDSASSPLCHPKQASAECTFLLAAPLEPCRCCHPGHSWLAVKSQLSSSRNRRSSCRAVSAIRRRNSKHELHAHLCRCSRIRWCRAHVPGRNALRLEELREDGARQNLHLVGLYWSRVMHVHGGAGRGGLVGVRT